MKNQNIIIMSVTMMDFITALIVLINPHPVLVARMGLFYELFPIPYIGAFVMFLAVILASIALIFPKINQWKFLLLFPQQFFLMLTTGSALQYIIVSHYADGVIRPWQFILQDQLPSIILTIAYAFSIIDLYRYKIEYGKQ